MKRIVFTLKDGQKVGWRRLTGIPDPTSRLGSVSFLEMSAKAAMDTDDRIASFEIVDADEEESSPSVP